MTQSDVWLWTFLRASSRSELLGRPDGRELYRYRTTQEEYDRLKAALRADLTPVSFADAVESTHQAFVLFVAEWFKREYAAADWTWATLLKALGSSEAERTPPFYERLERSFRFWRVRVEYAGDGEKYRDWLGTLLRASGLPIKLLAKEGTPFRAAFQRLLVEIERRPIEDRQQLAESAFEKTAGIYRHQSMLQNVLQVVDVLLQNRQLIRLGGLADELKGKDRLPFQVDDQEARDLLGSLVKAAGEAQDLIFGEQFRVETRALLDFGGKTWEIEREVVAPRSSNTDTFKKRVPPVAGEDADEFPSTGIVSAYAGTARIPVADFAHEDDGGKLRFTSRSDAVLRSEIALHAINLGVASGGRLRFLTSEPVGPNIDALPWVFGALASDGYAPLVATRGFRTSGPELLVALPFGAEWNGEPPPLEAPCGPGGRSLYKVVARAVARSGGDGGVWSFAARTPAEETAEFLLKGTRRTLFGREVLANARVVEGEFGSQRLVGDAEFIPDHGSAERLSDSSYGAGWVRVRRGEELLFRERATLIPSRLKARAERDGHSWMLEGARTRQVTSVPALAVQFLDSDRTRVPFGDLRSDAAITLAWIGSGSVVFTLPRPDRSAAFVGADDVHLSDEEAVALGELGNVRAIAVDVGGDSTCELAVTFDSPPTADDPIDLGSGHIEMYFPMPTSNGLFEADSREVRRKLEILFDSTRSHMAKAQARVEARPTAIRNAPKLNIRRYSHSLVRSESGQEIGLSPPASVGVHCTALRLWNPAGKPVMIDAREDGSWDLNALPQAEPGPWILAVRTQTGALLAAPTMHVVPGVPWKSGSPLIEAMFEPSRGQRASSLRQALEDMAKEPENRDWKVFDEFMGTLEDFPPQTFDAIVELSATPNAAVACLLRVGRAAAKRLVERLEDLPFLWCAVPWTSWQRAAGLLMQYSEAPEAQVCGQIGLVSDARLQVVTARFEWLRETCGQRELAEVHRRAMSGSVSASALQAEKLNAEVQQACGESVVGRDTVVCGLRWSATESAALRVRVDQWSGSAGISQLLRWLDRQEASARVEPYLLGPLLCALSAANRHQLEPRYVPFARAARESQPVLFQKLFDLFFLHFVSR